jgi:uncharacterized protein (DUF433 family)
MQQGETTMDETMIISDPNIMVGKTVTRGTRITVDLILGKLAAGQTFEQILEDYPHITREGIKAALEFAACRSSRWTLESNCDRLSDMQ